MLQNSQNKQTYNYSYCHIHAHDVMYTAQSQWTKRQWETKIPDKRTPLYAKLIILECLSVIQDAYQLLLFLLLCACWASGWQSDGRRTIICCLRAVTDDSTSQGKQLNNNYTCISSHRKCSFPTVSFLHTGTDMVKPIHVSSHTHTLRILVHMQTRCHTMTVLLVCHYECKWDTEKW